MVSKGHSAADRQRVYSAQFRPRDSEPRGPSLGRQSSRYRGIQTPSRIAFQNSPGASCSDCAGQDSRITKAQIRVRVASQIGGLLAQASICPPNRVNSTSGELAHFDRIEERHPFLAERGEWAHAHNIVFSSLLCSIISKERLANPKVWCIGISGLCIPLQRVECHKARRFNIWR
jgi:hypothetical protein